VPFHWLDANIFIEAQNGPYASDLVPSFWKWLEGAIKADLVRSSTRVCTELTKGKKDHLSRWANQMKPSLFMSENSAVQKHFGEIAAFVQSNYAMPYATRFLSGADPWIIAHAMDNKGTVVTHEVYSEGKEVKIPNMCEQFSVPYLGAYAALRKLGMRI